MAIISQNFRASIHLALMYGGIEVWAVPRVQKPTAIVRAL